MRPLHILRLEDETGREKSLRLCGSIPDASAGRRIFRSTKGRGRYRVLYQELRACRAQRGAELAYNLSQALAGEFLT